MRKKKIHMKARPPNLASFTTCGLWIYELASKHHDEKLIATVKKDVNCERCKNTIQYKDW